MDYAIPVVKLAWQSMKPPNCRVLSSFWPFWPISSNKNGKQNKNTPSLVLLELGSHPPVRHHISQSQRPFGLLRYRATLRHETFGFGILKIALMLWENMVFLWEMNVKTEWKLLFYALAIFISLSLALQTQSGSAKSSTPSEIKAWWLSAKALTENKRKDLQNWDCNPRRMNESTQRYKNARLFWLSSQIEWWMEKLWKNNTHLFVKQETKATHQYPTEQGP